MTDQNFDRDSWEQRWRTALGDHPERVASRPPNHHFLAELADLASTPGRALDAGCGHGAEAMWLASAGWQVTAVDFSRTALDHARTTAEALGVADRIEWVEGDLGVWAPAPQSFDLVSCLYVHVAGSVRETVARLASGVAPGGTLLLVGHQPVDPETGAPTPAAGQVQVSVAAALDALDESWRIDVAEERRRPDAASGVDDVVRATYLPSAT